MVKNIKKNMNKMPKVIGQSFVKSVWARHRPVLYRPSLRMLPGVGWLFTYLDDVLKDVQEWEQQQEAAEAAPDEAIGEGAIAPVSTSESLYKVYRCQAHDPLNCQQPELTLQETPGAKFCQGCGFPVTLAAKTEIRGNRSTYRVHQFLGRRGKGRLYSGIQLADSQPVVIKEYLLPGRCFNREETEQRKQMFSRLAGVDLADGRVQDFRVIAPWDAIGDANQERCYIINRGTLDTAPTLSTYLARHGTLTDKQVRRVLDQVLQTLEFLHQQKYRLPSGHIQSGIPHGNLNLDSLLISKRELSARNQDLPAWGRTETADYNCDTPLLPESPFFIYTCDLGLWEHLFDPPTVPTSEFSPRHDLIALGQLSFYLLTGHPSLAPTILATTPPSAHQPPLDPANPANWRNTHPALQAFICRLLEFGTPFENATAARRALLQIPEDLPVIADLNLTATDAADQIYRPPVWIPIVLLALLVSGLAWWLLKPRSPLTLSPIAQSAPIDLAPATVQEVAAVPAGKFTYTAERDGTWSYILQQANLVLAGKTLAEELRERKPKLELTYTPEPTVEAAIASLQANRAAFAVTTLATLPTHLTSQPIAYDGLSVFVAFSYARRQNSLPSKLNGQIRFDQLRRLYTGKIANWRELGGPDLPVQLYMPTEAAAVRVFEERVLKDDQSIAQFRHLQGSLITPLPTFELLRQVIRDFEDGQVGAIAFGTLSKTFGQCSAYSLAIADQDQVPVQPMVRLDGQPITPTTNLCDEKGSYFLHTELFPTQRYALAYPLSVIYPRDNSRPAAGAKFAEMLKTQEGQRLLSKTGLVPLQPLPRER